MGIADMDSLLTTACNWAACHPRLTCVFVCALIMMAGFLEVPGQ